MLEKHGFKVPLEKDGAKRKQKEASKSEIQSTTSKQTTGSKKSEGGKSSSSKHVATKNKSAVNAEKL